MNEYTIRFARAARKELEKLSAAQVLRLLPKIEALAQEPRPSGCRKLRGTRNQWRIRVGDHRILYEVDDDEHIVEIAAVRHCSEAYR